jgi:hypothetical protein
VFIDSTLISDGLHNFQVLVRDQSPEAVLTLIGERNFTVNNPP